MQPAPQWIFGPFRLDLDNACLWHGPAMLSLPPTLLTLLHYLVMHAGQLVTKEELLAAVWPETAVGDAVLKVRIGDLRKMLGETARTAQYIATVHRHGYRFIAPVTTATYVQGEHATRSLSSPFRARSAPHPLVGREAALDRLYQWLTQVRQGQRQMGFVTGKAGIGKIALVETFVAQAATDAALWIASGQCIEHYGAGEAYLPVLEALGRLCRAPRGAHLLALLHQCAPTWLVQMPWLLSAADRTALQRELLGATQERMLREMAEWIEALTVETPLLLVLEDLHWSDAATLDLVAWLARRQERARLLLLGTYRPMEVITRGHPLRRLQQTLQTHGYCAELPLPGLSDTAVAAYVTARLPGYQDPTALAQVLYQRTEGNPLFMVHVVEELVA